MAEIIITVTKEQYDSIVKGMTWEQFEAMMQYKMGQEINKAAQDGEEVEGKREVAYRARIVEVFAKAKDETTKGEIVEAVEGAIKAEQAKEVV